MADRPAVAAAPKNPKSLTGLLPFLRPYRLRIGLALVKGLSMGLNVPVVGVPSLDILAANIPVGDLPLLTALQAGRGRCDDESCPC